MGVIDYDLRGGDLSGLGFNCMIFVYRDNCMLSEIGNTGSCFSLLEFRILFYYKQCFITKH